MKKKPYWEMDAGELAEATKEFDAPFVVDKSRPLTPSERKRWRSAKKKRGRPKVGRGFKRISVSIERGLLGRVNALARKRGVNRSKLLALVLEEAIARDRSQGIRPIALVGTIALLTAYLVAACLPLRSPG